MPNSVAIGRCQSYDNYAWIEHPNGEWSKYTHLATGSVSATWSIGDVVSVGQLLGIESDIGAATGAASCMGPRSTIGCGRHLHHEIAIRSDPTDNTPFSDGAFVADTRFPVVDDDPLGQGYFAGGFIQGTNLVPVVCDIGAPNLYAAGSSYLVGTKCRSAPRNRDLSWKQAFASAPSLTPLGHRRFSHCQQLGLDGLIARALDRVRRASLPPGEREALLERVREIARSHPDLDGRERLELPHRTDVYWCRRGEPQPPG